MQCIAFDSHKHYTWALVQDETGRLMREQRDVLPSKRDIWLFVDCARDLLRRFLGVQLCVLLNERYIQSDQIREEIGPLYDLSYVRE